MPNDHYCHWRLLRLRFISQLARSCQCECVAYGFKFSAFPGAVFKSLARACPFSGLIKVIVSPCLSYLEHATRPASFQLVQLVFSLIAHVPCHSSPLGVL